MTGARLTIDELRDIQRARDLLDAHVVSIDADGFTIARASTPSPSISPTPSARATVQTPTTSSRSRPRCWS
jgi:hypothetical protein